MRSRAQRWVILLSALCALIGNAHAAWARGPSSLVVLVGSAPASDVTQALERDLQGLGLSVLVLAATAENSSGRASLERTARSFGAIAAVRLVPEGQDIEVWVVDRVTNKTVIRTLAASEGTVADPNEISLGVIELMRASLLELHVPGAPAGEVEPSRNVRKLSNVTRERQPPLFSLSGGVGVEPGLRSLGPSLHATWSTWARVYACFGAKAFASVPIQAEQATYDEGQVELDATLFGLGPTCSLASGRELVAPRVGLGVLLANVATQGQARAGLTSNAERAWLWGGYALFGASVRLLDDVRLNLELTGLTLASPAVVIVDQRRIARWGAPGALSTLSVEVLVGP
jgi:hypothetical protein